MKVIEVWRWPVRLMHWSMVASFTVAFLDRHSELDRMNHVYAGYVMGAILVTRIAYGFLANDLAAFRRFPPSITKGLKYTFDLLRGRARNQLGHNPAGALAIYGMLSLGLLAVGSGYWAFEYNEDWAKDWHGYLTYAWFWLVCVHIFGVTVASLAHREFLVKAMITGCKSRRCISEPFSLRAAGMTLLILVLRVFNLVLVLFGGKGFVRKK